MKVGCPITLMLITGMVYLTSLSRAIKETALNFTTLWSVLEFGNQDITTGMHACLRCTTNKFPILRFAFSASLN